MTSAAAAESGDRAPLRPVTAALAAVRRAPTSLVAREVALQLLVVVLGSAVATAGGLGASSAMWAVAAGALVLVRLRWPAAATLVAGAASTFSVGSGLAAALGAATLGRREQQRWRTARVVGAAAALAVATRLAVTGDLRSGLLVALAQAVLLLAVPALCGALVGGRRPAARLLAERNAYLERARALTVEQARWEERGRITSEMHDLLGHRLSLLCVQAGALQVHADGQDPATSVQARLVRGTAVAALDELRAVLETTGVPQTCHDTEHGAPGTSQGVSELARHWRRGGVQVSATWQGEEIAQAHLRQALDRAVREGVTNAHKHAPGATASIAVRTSDQRITFSVRTTASPSPTTGPPGSGLGLIALAERARLLGGRATYGPTDDGGFELAVDLPVHAPPTPAPPPAAAVLQPPPPVRARDVLTWPRVAAALALAGALPLAAVLTGALARVP